MASRCNICIDPMCGGKQNCNCDDCDKKDCCHRVLSPTIRITTKCTQSCKHCCFSCSPNRDDFMSLDKAVEVNRFLISNKIYYINVMGGEFFLHPQWFEIISTLSNGIDIIRIATNGDWVKTEGKQVKYLAKKYPVVMSISKDIWHTNKNVRAAQKFCSNNKIPYKLATEEQTKGDSIVPVGRALYEYNFYSSFGTYCSKPDRKYSFLIDENGLIHKCPFGMWEYDDICAFLDGGFDERFKEFTSAFHSTFIANCAECIRFWHKVRKEEEAIR